MESLRRPSLENKARLILAFPAVPLLVSTMAASCMAYGCSNIPMIKIWVFVSVNCASAQMTSLKRRREGRRGSGRNSRRERGRKGSTRRTLWFAQSVLYQKTSIDSLPLFPGWTCHSARICYPMTLAEKVAHNSKRSYGKSFPL